MPAGLSANMKVKIRTSKGAQMESSGPCSDEEAFAVYMLCCFDESTKDLPEDSPAVTKFRKDVRKFREQCRAYREAVAP